MKRLVWIGVMLAVSGVVVTLAIVVRGSSAPPASRQVAQRWAQATTIGDYATTRELAAFGGWEYTLWLGETQNLHARNALQRFNIVREERQGDTFVYCIDYAGADPVWPNRSASVRINSSGEVLSSSSYGVKPCTSGGK